MIHHVGDAEGHTFNIMANTTILGPERALKLHTHSPGQRER